MVRNMMPNFFSFPSSHRINKILSKYQQIANSSPIELRMNIPSSELWRFFIDGEIQKLGRELLKQGLFASYSKADSFLEQTELDFTVSEYITFMEEGDLFGSELKTVLTENDWILNEQECNTYTLRDILNLDQAWIPFERNEPGYLKALYKAFSRIFDLSNEITTDFILELHKLATQEVKLDSFNKKSKENVFINKKGEFRFGDLSYFGVCPDNFSRNGFHELIMQWKKNCLQDISIGIYFNTGFYFEVNHKFFTKLEDIQKCNTNIPYPQLKKLLRAKNDLEVSDALYRMAQSQHHGNYIKYDMYLQSRQSENTNEVLNNKVKDLITIYQDNISKAKSAEEKLLVIISFIQSCEQLHPFFDGNCRVFCMLLLNHLLIKNGFPLVILDDPNKLDGFSKKEIMNELIKGMENTFKLIENHTLYDVNTNDVIQLLESKEYFSNLLNYFREATQIEDEARDSLLLQHTHKTL